MNSVLPKVVLHVIMALNVYLVAPSSRHQPLMATPQPNTLSRTSRASTLPTHSPDIPGQKRHHHHGHASSHKHHRSHQITRHVADQLPSFSQTTSPLGDLFSPVRSVAGGLSELTRWNNSSGEREKQDKSSERATDNENSESERKEKAVSWDDVRRARAKRVLREKYSLPFSLSKTHT